MFIRGLVAVFCLFVSKARSKETFDEELTIKPLRDGRVETKFVFKTLLVDALPRNPESLNSEDTSQHYAVFPLALGQILREYAVTELHLSLNAGKWDYDRWGLPLEQGVGTGAELLAWIADGAPTTVDERWKGLRNALAGLFCASLGHLDDLRTTSPATFFQPEGALPNWGTPHQVRYATLPSEHVCTENLTPFLKLLPCKSLSGIAALLNPHRLFDADWHGMAVHVLWRPNVGVEVRLTFQSVSNPLRPAYAKKQDWSLQTLFDRTITNRCPVARSSRVVIALPSPEEFTLTPEATQRDSSSAVYDVNQADRPLDIGMRWPDEFAYPLSFEGTFPLSVRRTLKGTSQARAQLSVVIKNDLLIPIDLAYLETMPWLVQFYIHTLHTQVNGRINDDAISGISYIPAIAHSRPTTFQCVLHVPAKGTLRLSMDVTKAFLRYTEHPPDAQRGWDLPPAILMPVVGAGSNATLPESLRDTRIYTSTLLIDLATPDFSMPYNVIIFSCSLMAFIFGTIFNLLTRKFVVVYVPEKQGS